MMELERNYLTAKGDDAKYSGRWWDGREKPFKGGMGDCSVLRLVFEFGILILCYN